MHKVMSHSVQLLGVLGAQCVSLLHIDEKDLGQRKPLGMELRISAGGRPRGSLWGSHTVASATHARSQIGAGHTPLLTAEQRPSARRHPLWIPHTLMDPAA